MPSHEEMAQFMADFHGLPVVEIFDDLFERTGDDAIRHLFTVAASLDSMVVGEPQILAQVKQAYELATARESTGPLTHGAFQAAVRVARRVTIGDDDPSPPGEHSQRGGGRFRQRGFREL